MNLAQKNCQSCDGDIHPLNKNEIAEYLKELKNEWENVEGKKIRNKFTFTDFKTAMVFVNKVADLSEAQNHHPNIKIFYDKVVIELTTHSIGGLSENDFIMASKIEQL